MSVPRYPNETTDEPVHPVDAPTVSTIDAVIERADQLGVQTNQATIDKLHAIFPVHPVDAMGEVAAQMFPGEEMNPEQVAIGRALCDEPVCLTVAPSDPTLDDRVAAAAAFSYDDPETVALITGMRQQIADLEAKLDAERTLRAQGAAELEREKAHERDRRIQAESRARDALWALDAAIEALTPLAGYATEEDGRVAGMTAPVCLAMSSVRRADAMVKLHRALRR